MYAIRWLDLVVAACGQFLTHGAAAISKQPAVPEPVASGKGMWQASAPVCITTEGPAFNKDAYGSLQGVTVKWSSTRSNDPGHKCAAGDKKCVADTARSAQDCKHLDVYTTPFAPVTTIVDPSSNELWESIHTVVLCQPDKQNAGNVKLHSGEDTIDCSVKTEKDQAGQVMACHYCVVSEVSKFQSQPFHWEGASINYIFGIHGERAEPAEQADVTPMEQASESAMDEAQLLAELKKKGVVQLNRPWLDRFITPEHVSFWAQRQAKRDANRNSIKNDNFNQLRHAYCEKEAAETPDEFKFPQELKAYLDGSSLEGAAGKFDAAAVMEHAQNLQAALMFYQEGLQLDAQNNFPASDSSSTWEKYKEHASQNLLNSLIGEADEYVVGVIGDSGTAGQDNCYFDGWMPTFERVMGPLFAAMGKKLVMRNAGRNGGLGASWSLACLDTMVGSDIDALMIAFHGVGFGRGFDEEENLARDPMATLGHGGRPMADDTDAAMEATLRRALNRRQVVFSDTKTFAHGVNEQYNEYGVTSGTTRLQWQPEGRPQQDDPFWGSVGDGRCHNIHTVRQFCSMVQDLACRATWPFNQG